MDNLALINLTELLYNKRDLAQADAAAAAGALADGAIDADSKKDFLRALAQKGETATEVSAFANTYLGLAMDPQLGDTSYAIDVVGTGGDQSGSFNISTASSIILAAGGVPVVKHGNRSVTSKCGSADILEAIGIDLQAEPAKLRDAYETLNFTFLFAPAFHPAFKEVVPIRKALAAEGQRTIFNLLGPLINPGRPGYLLMGVFAGAWAKPLSEALAALGKKSGLVVHSSLGEGVVMDELTCAGDNRVVGFGGLRGMDDMLTAADAGLPHCDFASLAGGDREQNLALFEKVIDGNAPQGLMDTISMNVGAALWITGRAKDLSTGAEQAKTIMRSGAVREWIHKAERFFT